MAARGHARGSLFHPCPQDRFAALRDPRGVLSGKPWRDRWHWNNCDAVYLYWFVSYGEHHALPRADGSDSTPAAGESSRQHRAGECYCEMRMPSLARNLSDLLQFRELFGPFDPVTKVNMRDYTL